MGLLYLLHEHIGLFPKVMKCFHYCSNYSIVLSVYLPNRTGCISKKHAHTCKLHAFHNYHFSVPNTRLYSNTQDFITTPLVQGSLAF